MKTDSNVRRTVRCITTASALWLATLGTAVAQSPAPGVTVAVFADHYVLAGRSIDDLDALEDAVTAIRPQRVRIEACGEGTARAQRAAAHRFRNLYLELSAGGADAATCQPASISRAVPVSQRVGQRPFGIYDDAVDRWWNNLMP